MGIASASVELKAETSPWVKFFGVVAVGLLWNGIVSVFVYQVIQMWRQGDAADSKWYMTLFLTPFVAVGLVLIGASGYTFLALFNPRARLRVNAPSVALGEFLEVHWTIDGQFYRVQTLQITLEGYEEATYRRGTSTDTDKSTFATVPIATVTHAPDIRSGHATVRVPLHSMHTFTAEYNKIVWCIQVNGDIPNWPDLNQEYPIVVQPVRLHRELE
jgi:hypothetical protein